MVPRRDIRTLLLEIMSFACCRYHIRPIRRMGIGRVGLLEKTTGTGYTFRPKG